MRQSKNEVAVDTEKTRGKAPNQKHIPKAIRVMSRFWRNLEINISQQLYEDWVFELSDSA